MDLRVLGVAFLLCACVHVWVCAKVPRNDMPQCMVMGSTLMYTLTQTTMQAHITKPHKNHLKTSFPSKIAPN